MDNDNFNNDVKSGTRNCVNALKSRITQLGIKHISSSSNPDPLTNVKARTLQKDGMINRVRFTFKRTGVFVHKGVGRGTKAAQAGTTKRVAKEWFNPVIDEFADELMDKTGDQNVEIAYDKMKIK